MSERYLINKIFILSQCEHSQEQLDSWRDILKGTCFCYQLGRLTAIRFQVLGDAYRSQTLRNQCMQMKYLAVLQKLLGTRYDYFTVCILRGVHTTAQMLQFLKSMFSL